MASIRLEWQNLPLSLFLSKTICVNYGLKQVSASEELMMPTTKSMSALETFLKGEKREYSAISEEILRQWINLEITDVKKLAGGFSGAAVWRLKFKISYPGCGVPSTLPVVIKTDSKHAFWNENNKFNQIPAAIKNYFVQYQGNPIGITLEGKALNCMIMEFLGEYDTLHNIIRDSSLASVYNRIIDGGFDISKLMYKTILKEKSSGITHFLYFGRIQKHLAEVASQGLFLREINAIRLKLSEISKFIAELEPAKTTMMHGDFHARNIMAKVSYPEKELVGIKFIDIDELDFEGDYIYDLGELMGDVSFFGHIYDLRPSFNISCEKVHELSLKAPFSLISDKIKRTVEEISKVVEPTTDQNCINARLLLSESRYFAYLVPLQQNEWQSKLLLDEILSVMSECLNLLKE
jgi:hypothetical protein